jgi:glycosyltransferase involved in cell wall biosynthesis
MKKAAFIFWHLGIGGVGTRLGDVVGVLAKEDQQVEPLLFLKNKKTNPRSLPKKTFYFSTEFSGGNKYFFFWWLLKNLWREEPDYVVAFLNRFALVAVVYKLVSFLKRKRVKVVINQTVVISDYLKQYEAFYWRWLSKWSFKLADIIVVNTKAVKLDLINSYQLRESKIKVIYSWSKQAEKPIKMKKKHDAIFVGRLSPEKGVEALIETAMLFKKEGKKKTLAIVGDGELADWLQAEIKKRELSAVVDYLGYQSNPKKLIKAAKVLLLPSRNEGLPMVILEAYSVGVPAIVTPFLGADEVVEDSRTGLIVSREEFAQAVVKLLENDKKLRQLSKQAKQKAINDFSMGNLDKFIKEIFSA